MRIASMIMGAALAVAATAAYADTTTMRVVSWDPARKLMTFDDKTKVFIEPAIVPADLQPGDTVTLTFQANDNGYEKIESVTRKN